MKIQLPQKLNVDIILGTYGWRCLGNPIRTFCGNNSKMQGHYVPVEDFNKTFGSFLGCRTMAAVLSHLRLNPRLFGNKAYWRSASDLDGSSLAVLEVYTDVFYGPLGDIYNGYLKICMGPDIWMLTKLTLAPKKKLGHISLHRMHIRNWESVMKDLAVMCHQWERCQSYLSVCMQIRRNYSSCWSIIIEFCCIWSRQNM